MVDCDLPWHFKEKRYKSGGEGFTSCEIAKYNDIDAEISNVNLDNF